MEIIKGKFKGLFFEEKKTIKCNECNLCVKACKNNVLDNGFCKEKCKSYLTQYKNNKLDYMFNETIVGCDCCMEVCPYNKHVETINIGKTMYNQLDLDYLLEVSNRQFKKDFKESE